MLVVLLIIKNLEKKKTSAPAGPAGWLTGIHSIRVLLFNSPESLRFVIYLFIGKVPEIVYVKLYLI